MSQRLSWSVRLKKTRTILLELNLTYQAVPYFTSAMYLFRKRRPYGAGSNAEDTMIRNSLRVAHVWMDKYIDYYYQVKKHIQWTSEILEQV